MSDKLTKRFITCGYVAAICDAGLIAIGAIEGTYGLSAQNFINAAVFLALAFGIFRRSRICAILVLLYFVAEAGAMYPDLRASVDQFGGGILDPLWPSIFWILALWISLALAGILFSLGVVGTFSWHARERLAPLQP
jgi:hypothetical protein